MYTTKRRGPGLRVNTHCSEVGGSGSGYYTGGKSPLILATSKKALKLRSSLMASRTECSSKDNSKFAIHAASDSPVTPAVTPAVKYHHLNRIQHKCINEMEVDLMKQFNQACEIGAIVVVGPPGSSPAAFTRPNSCTNLCNKFDGSSQFSSLPRSMSDPLDSSLNDSSNSDSSEHSSPLTSGYVPFRFSMLIPRKNRGEESIRDGDSGGAGRQLLRWVKLARGWVSAAVASAVAAAAVGKEGALSSVLSTPPIQYGSAHWELGHADLYAKP